MPGRFGFLPHARNAVAANAQSQGLRLSSEFDVKVMGDGAQQGAPVPIAATLRGPGDVIGVAPDQIARFEPAPGQRGFEPNYFPFVEFVDVDFPWRYSLTTGTPNKVAPWLALIALRGDEFDLVDQGRAPLPRLRVHVEGDSLPNPAQSWAWAHVQVNLDTAGGATAAEMLAADPANGFARLFCMRKLAARTRYHLFVVPLYEAGRLTGLGQRPDGATGNAPAWTHGGSEAVELPYYASSELTTDAGADIEQLVRKLRAFKADEGDETGAPKRASADRPGYYPAYEGANQSFEIQTALTQADHKAEGYNTDPELAKAMAATLTEVIAGEGDADDNDPLVAFPPYGFRFREETQASVTKAQRGAWFDRTNLDLKMRHAAARGATVVRENQEEFAKAAWDQFDTIMEANQKLRQLRLAEQVVRRLSTKHLSKLPADVVTVLGEPMQPYVRVSEARGTQSIADTLSDAGSPGAFASRGMRRLAAKRPMKTPGQPVGCMIPTPRIKGDVTAFEAVQRKQIQVQPMAFFSANMLGAGVAAHYVNMFGAGTMKAKPRKAQFEVKKVRSATFSKSLRDTMVALPGLKANFIIKGRSEAEQKELAPLWRSPRIPVPMAAALTRIERDAILSGVGDLPDNTVSLFAENRAFIEAFMVGANHAMNDELRWREFPTDMRGTIFDRFWDRGAALSDTTSADIAGIDQWKGTLGRNPNPSNPDGNPALVIVIKGDIVRKLGDPIIVVNNGIGTWSPGTGRDFEPVFFGKMGREIAYFGFDLPERDVLANPDQYRLVIYEPMGRLRFGLDVGTAAVRRARTDRQALSLNFPMKHRAAHVRVLPAVATLTPPPASNAIPDWDDLSWSHMGALPAGYINVARTITTQTGADLWGSGKTSASLARSFWQKPVAAVLPFERVLP